MTELGGIFLISLFRNGSRSSIYSEVGSLSYACAREANEQLGKKKFLTSEKGLSLRVIHTSEAFGTDGGLTSRRSNMAMPVLDLFFF